MTNSPGGSAEDSFALAVALLSGEVVLGSGDPFEIARGAFVAAIEAADPEWSPRAAYRWAMALLDRGELAEADDYVIIAMASGHPQWSVGAILVYALIAAERQQTELAINAFHQVTETGVEQFLPSAWFNLGLLHQRRTAWSEAVEAYERTLATNDPMLTPKAEVNIGCIRFHHLQDASGARQAFQRAIASGDPEQTQLALANLELIDRQEQLTRTAEPAPDQGMAPPAVRRAGREKRRWRPFGTTRPTDSPTDAVPTDQNAADHDGADHNAVVHGPAGQESVAQNVTLDIAAEAVGIGIPTFLVKDFDEVTIGLAAAEQEKGETEKAESILRPLADSNRPSRALASLNLGLLREQRGDHDGARQAYEAALRGDDPISAGAAALNLGLMAVHGSDFIEAERLFRLAAESEHPDARGAGALNLAAVLVRREDVTEARRIYQQVMSSGHPQHAQTATARLAKLP
ncbi:tetratricopeptide repeat protein [Kineosporia sp. NBRC 101731]|uniref:tetratricopeptide repeat protein n=1 Tax=Kineosporia sp. NBRC 101731 TaxID=3032199 RepID=UPI0024A0ADBB|nr:tetratricopeptide repeat protein [Kineosporia sp. NBRC 101731]GLY29823.1 hypothetical protein Kisp02_31880 [Kineosporia sp. NBRC 101731]